MHLVEPDDSLCPWRDDVLARLLGEPATRAADAVESHVANCADCQRLRAAFTTVAAALRAVPAAPAPDLAEAVLAQTVNARPPLRWLPLAAAAVLTLLAGGLLWRVAGRPSPAVATLEPEAAGEVRVEPATRVAQDVAAPRAAGDDMLQRAVAWLASAQSPQGSWAASTWGAQSNYTVGVSALATLALLSEPSGEGAVAAQAAVQRAVPYLLSQQRADGLFGPAVTGSLYNHALATLALLEAEAAGGVVVPADRRQAALDLLARAQHAEGGWTYLRAPNGRANSSLTVWALLALTRADELDRRTADGAVARGLAWLERTIDDEGRAGYRAAGDHPRGPESLTAAAAVCLLGRPAPARSRLGRVLAQVRDDVARADGAPDFYRTFFQATALRGAGLGDSTELAHLEEQLALLQERGGGAAGSWAATDQWARAGGRVYATAMAVLALRGP